MRLEFPEQSFDVVLVGDVFEYLSSQVLAIASGETLRVSRELIVINFFNVEATPEHIANPISR